MIGITRLVLSLVVMASHLTQRFSTDFAGMSVFGFYIMAGYFATASMQGRYKGNPAAFLLSRWLRLWPVYLVVFVATLLLIPFIYVNTRIGISSVLELLPQLFMIVPRWPDMAVVPVGWMIKWILLGYLIVALGASRTPRTAGIWLLVSLVIGQQAAINAGSGWGVYYGSFAFASQGLAGGVTLWHLGFTLQRDGMIGVWAGKLSYPVYLVHSVVEVIFMSIGFSQGWPLFFASLPPTLALSWLLLRFVEGPVDRFRKSLKTQES
jgi:peptidoglycan/LPS O-acetylase OafA/YrhL